MAGKEAINPATKISLRLFGLSLLLLFLPPVHAEPAPGADGVKPVNLPVIRDTFVSAAPGEKAGNNGRSRRLKVKGRQEYLLFDIDVGPLKGHRIQKAVLHLRSATPEQAPLAWLGVSALASPWNEGSSERYQPQKGAACFLQARYQERDWAGADSTLLNVVFARGHAAWKTCLCTPPDEDGWQQCPVLPALVAARLAGLSHGFCLFDDLGSVWSLKKGDFTFSYSPNRWLYSRESFISKPWMAVWPGPSDDQPPEPVSGIETETRGLPAGQAVVTWKSPADPGGGRTLGFQVTYADGGKRIAVPRYLIPMAKAPGERVRMHLRDLPLEPGQLVRLTIQPVDAAGNVGAAVSQDIPLSPKLPLSIPLADVRPFPPSDKIPAVGGVEVFVLDPLDKQDPVTGELIPPHPKGYRRGNHLFSAEKQRIRLYGARNSHVAFQIGFCGKQADMKISCRFKDQPELKVRLHEFAYVRPKEAPDRILPDPLVPLSGRFSIPSTAGKTAVSGQRYHGLLAEIYLPHQIAPGEKRGTLTVTADGQRLRFDIRLRVWHFTLPDQLSFVPEMNAYGMKPISFYQLAHRHRCCLNCLPYGWSGKAGPAPRWDGKRFDWESWDAKVGPLLDGSAFSHLPRKGRPVDIFYLPLNENWPVDIFSHYQPAYWPDDALDPAYGEKLKKAFAAFARHLDQKGWHETVFQFYLNNKLYFRAQNPKSSAPWIFDEPQDIKDFFALRWYGQRWHEAVDPVRGEAKLAYRADISYSRFSRDLLWGILDISYLGGATPQKVKMKQAERRRWDWPALFAEYGTAGPVSGTNLQPLLWTVSTWAEGGTGVLPWQTIGSRKSWKTAAPTALFYPHPQGPLPSVRLKAFRQGQQDAEYLALFSHFRQVPRHRLNAWLAPYLGSSRVVRGYAADAGTARFESADPVKLWQMRYRLGKALSEMAPPYQAALPGWRDPRPAMKAVPDVGRVFQPLSHEKWMKPDCDTFTPRPTAP